jgi:hypothetical protein
MDPAGKDIRNREEIKDIKIKTEGGGLKGGAKGIWGCPVYVPAPPPDRWAGTRTRPPGNTCTNQSGQQGSANQSEVQ